MAEIAKPMKKVVLIVEKDKTRADQYFRNLCLQMRAHTLERVDTKSVQEGLALLKTRHVDVVVCYGSILTPEKARDTMGEPPLE